MRGESGGSEEPVNRNHDSGTGLTALNLLAPSPVASATLRPGDDEERMVTESLAWQ